MVCRRTVGALIVVATTLLVAPAPAGAGPLDDCAQRVIRDWYSGGRIDRLYPLACYRAALRALPEDVLHYSNADQDIRRALALARRGRSDTGGAPKTRTAPRPVERADADPAPPRPRPAKKAAPIETTVPESQPRPEPVASAAAAPRPRDTPVVASMTPASASIPYPILALAALAAVLLATGAVGWLTGRRG